MMNSKQKLGLVLVALLSAWLGLSIDQTITAADSKKLQDYLYEEVNGGLAVEAEGYHKQTLDKIRKWYLFDAKSQPKITPDADPPHLKGASGGAYLEILPDTRRNHGEKLISGKNFSNQPGKMAILHYNIYVNTPGRYYIWARIYSTNTEDNGLHVGIDGTWPESGQRIQFTKKKQWVWGSKQRTKKNHGGEPYKLYLDIKEAGEHTIMFSMREDGVEFDKWIMTNQKVKALNGPGPKTRLRKKTAKTKNSGEAKIESTLEKSKGIEKTKIEKGIDGDGKVTISGDLKQWHNVTLTIDGPHADENSNSPNPFLDYRMNVIFEHESGKLKYQVPGYFAADGDAANSSASAGTKWRAHLSPDRSGKWSYHVSFTQGSNVAINNKADGTSLSKYDGKKGSFNVAATDKKGRDLRAKGRLQYVGKHYLQFAGNAEYFIKAGADAPETLLGYADFDGTIAKKRNVPLKKYKPHLRDWRTGDPTWKNGKGKGLIGAVNYLSSKGCNAFSFLTYNAGGDGDNVWPFVSRNDKLHYDCSKLDQWAIIFNHATARGMYLHFKMQETEMDDNRRGKGKGGKVRESLDGGELGVERKLYCRELVARFGHNLALNWNLGEENTQTTAQQKAMAGYIAQLDAYDHNIVVHTFPNQQDKVYRPLLGKKSVFTGLSLQNSNIKDTHNQTLKWVRESSKAGKPWIVAFDESGSAAHGQCPDLGYRGFTGKDKDGKYIYTEHEVRKQTLWGTLMAGGAGVEYYFGYKFAENDLVCEDWRSRDRSWDYCRIALEFFAKNKIPFWQMKNANQLIGNNKNNNDKYCFAKQGEVYLVYLANGGTTKLDLSKTSGKYSVQWYNPRKGGKLLSGKITTVQAGSSVAIGTPPSDVKQDWLAVVRIAK